MILEAKALAKQYKNGRGLHEATFTLREGTILALAGGNGAGKSTLIRLLTGQDKVTAGELLWHGSSEVRYMPDDVDFPSTLTAEEILRLLASLKKVGTEQQQRVLERVGLWDVRKQRVQQFSKGMRQRLNLAQSLLGEGKLLILDEPTNGLDPYWIAELKKMMTEERNKGCTVLFSTHLLNFAEQLADDVLILHEGTVLATGPMDEVLRTNGAADLEQLWLKKIAE
ncbi:ABC transporter ATP-binding protein [Sporosarcina sp. GW1-11]|uniref:ABC transporter ATP-binding protein n=1 Tax=Sporosarcina sp. GW1-11 TaxID=2899126 RepID=UPI00294C43D5|nr:ABC transporter ATP-binding protein [Sporosarcina sp. GW1-11]MDV6377438.1 ABC transporter ATP-binding protein [Sporosarcina sp. GW1-11]